MKTDYIFFLVNQGKLPSWYGELALAMSGAGIKLIPVEKDQIMDLFKEEKKVALICYEISLGCRHVISPRLKKIFQMAMRGQKLILYHLSSFGAISEFNYFQKLAAYQYYRMPILPVELANEIRKSYHEEMNEDRTWPGGNRGGLPEFDVK